jgi:hypothetical protein
VRCCSHFGVHRGKGVTRLGGQWQRTLAEGSPMREVPGGGGGQPRVCGEATRSWEARGSADEVKRWPQWTGHEEALLIGGAGGASTSEWPSAHRLVMSRAQWLEEDLHLAGGGSHRRQWWR